MARLKSNQKPLFAAETAANIKVIVCVLASIVLMTLDHRQHLSTVRGVLATAVYPWQYLVQLPARTGGWLSEHLQSRSTLLEENQRLRQKQLFINAQLQKLTALEAENRRLRLLLESSVNLGERVLIAELLTVDFDSYHRHQILINKGSLHGVHVGQPLLDQEGIVGQIVHANPLTSTAILITDPNHALPVQVNRNGLRTLAVGTGNFNELKLPYIPNNDDIQVGDLLVTSGLGGRFPRGYPVAHVTEVSFDPGQPFARITAKPTAWLDRIREVLLITTPPGERPLPEDAAVLAEPTPAPPAEAASTVGQR